MVNLIKSYVEARIELLKLEATEKSAKVVSVTIYLMLVLLIGLFFFIFLTLGIGLLIGDWLGNHTYGILIVTAICLCTLLVFIFLKKYMIKKLINIILKTM